MQSWILLDLATTDASPCPFSFLEKGARNTDSSANAVFHTSRFCDSAYYGCVVVVSYRITTIQTSLSGYFAFA